MDHKLIASTEIIEMYGPYLFISSTVFSNLKLLQDLGIKEYYIYDHEDPNCIAKVLKSVNEMHDELVQYRKIWLPRNPIAFMSASNTWFLVKDKTMWMNADQANMAAIFRGCSGSHGMNGMYMHGNTHMACQSTYTTGGVSSPPPPPSPSPSSTATLTGLLGLVSATVVAFVLV